MAKSILNNNLSRVHTIACYIDYRYGTYTNTVYIPYGKTVDVWLGFTQPDDLVNPYQMQYRQTARRIASEAEKAGANWTGWLSGWKNARAMGASGSLPAVAEGATTDPDTWLRGNKVVDKTQLPTTCQHYTSFGIDTNKYDSISHAIRVRTYNGATQRHGAWVEGEIKFVQCASIEDTKVLVAPDGGLYVSFNHTHTRSVSAVVRGLEIGGKPAWKGGEYRVQCVAQTRSSTTTPTSRAGFNGAMFHIPAEMLTYAPTVSTSITFDATLYTDYLDAPTDFPVTLKTEANTTSISSPAMAYKTDKDAGTVTVTVSRTQGEIINDIGASVRDINGNSIQPISTSTGANGQYIGIYPIILDGRQYRIQGFASNQYNQTRGGSDYIYTSPKTNFCYITSADGVTNAILAGDLNLDISSETTTTAERPVGASAYMATWYAGSNVTYTLSGKAVRGRHQGDSGNEISKYNTIDAFNAMLKVPGKYAIRMPDGRAFNGVLIDMSINQDNAYTADITLTFNEVL